MASDKEKEKDSHSILTGEQDAVLDLYIRNLDRIYEEMKASDAIQVEIETQHLKRILST